MEPDTNDPINPMEAIAWLTKQETKQRFGKSNFTMCLQVIRNLILDRAHLNRKIEKMEKEIARLEARTKRGPWEVEGQGQWGLPDMPDSP